MKEADLSRIHHHLQEVPDGEPELRGHTGQLLGIPTTISPRPPPSVESETNLLRIRDQARAIVRAETTQNLEFPAILGLAEFLTTPDDPLKYRVDRLLPMGGRALLSAAYKSGKSTMSGNLIRSLADGTPFLDEFEVSPPAGPVVLIDDELDSRQLRRWLREQSVDNTDHVRIVPLRGQVATFNLLDPTLAARWAEELAGTGVLIFDCLRPVLDAAGLDENRDAGRWLVAFDELLRSAGIGEAVVVHHMGHTGERARGDSRLRDWPDAEWRLVRQQPEHGEEPDPAAPRFFSAFGRDVEVPEGALNYDPDRRRLSYREGSRKETKAAIASDAARPDILSALRAAGEPLSGRGVEDRMRSSGHGREAIRSALKNAIADGLVVTEDGPNRAVLHSLKPVGTPVRHGAPPDPWRTADECASAPLGGARRTTSPPATSTAPEGARGCRVCGTRTVDLDDNGVCPAIDSTHNHARHILNPNGAPP